MPLLMLSTHADAVIDSSSCISLLLLLPLLLLLKYIIPVPAMFPVCIKRSVPLFILPTAAMMPLLMLSTHPDAVIAAAAAAFATAA
jgi:hypothetical protein